MSRSYKKKAIIGNACSSSEKQDKIMANRKLRRKQKKAIIDLVLKNDTVLPSIKEVSDNWNFSKDGKQDCTGTEFEKKAKRK